ncbi:MAG: hypothetical protein RLP14_03645 [Owenweeksia sp.]
MKSDYFAVMRALSQKTYFLLMGLLCLLMFGCGEKDRSVTDVKENKLFNEELFTVYRVAEENKLTWNFFREGQVDSAIVQAFGLVQQAEIENVPDEIIIDAYFHLGLLLLRTDIPNLSEVYLKKAIDHYHASSFLPSPYLRKVYAAYASLGYAREEFQKAFEYYRNAMAICEKEMNPLLVAGMNNNLGLVHLKMKQNDSALYYFELAKSYHTDHKIDFSELVFSMNNNLGQVNYLLGDYERSLSMYSENFERAQLLLGEYNQAPKRMVTSSVGMALNYLDLQRLNEAERQINIGASFLDQLNTYDRKKHKPEVLDIKRKIAYIRGSITDYDYHNRQMEALTDSLDQDRQESMALVTAKIADLQLKLSQLKVDSQAVKQQLNRVLMLSIGIVFMLLAGLLLIALRKRNNELAAQKVLTDTEKRNKELEKEKLELQLRNQKRDLNELAAHTSALRNIAEETRQKLKILNRFGEDKQKEELRQLSNLISTQVNESRVKSLLQQNLEKVNQEFFDKLKKHTRQNLSRREKEFCALVRLNFTNNQIAELNSVGEGAVRVSKHRIKQKLGLEKQDSLQEFLNQLY